MAPHLTASQGRGTALPREAMAWCSHALQRTATALPRWAGRSMAGQRTATQSEARQGRGTARRSMARRCAAQLRTAQLRTAQQRQYAAGRSRHAGGTENDANGGLTLRGDGCIMAGANSRSVQLLTAGFSMPGVHNRISHHSQAVACVGGIGYQPAVSWTLRGPEPVSSAQATAFFVGGTFERETEPGEATRPWRIIGRLSH